MAASWRKHGSVAAGGRHGISGIAKAHGAGAQQRISAL
jgi:hypothetical protein